MTEEQVNNLSKRRRIFELDLLRGFFVVIIIIDHLQLWPSPLRYLTGEGRLWVTAAEGFFLISGLLVGYIRGFNNFGNYIFYKNVRWWKCNSTRPTK